MGAVFALFAGFYYWIGKITGYAYPDWLGKLHFWVMFAGVLNWLRFTWLDAGTSIFKILSHLESNLNINRIRGKRYIIKDYVTRIYMENDNIKGDNKLSIIPNRQSAGVHAPQRINAKDLWYILGLIEGNGSFSCYMEKNTHVIQVELSITLELSDIKLLYWIRKKLGYGVVKILKNSSKGSYVKYIIRSKEFINNNIFYWFDKYPPLTINKIKRIKYIKDCLFSNKCLPKDFLINIDRLFPENIDEYMDDWIVGFIESKGNFYFVDRFGKRCAEFNLSEMKDKELLELISKQIELSLLNKINKSNSNNCILIVEKLKDIQSIINFMYRKDRVRLKGIKKVKFLKWISELRVSPRYNGLKIPLKY